jgi:hypothetical protein
MKGSLVAEAYREGLLFEKNIGNWQKHFLSRMENQKSYHPISEIPRT